MSAENPDTYHFPADCPFCKEKRGVACSMSQAKTGDLIEVYAIQCDHHWKLTSDESNKLRKSSDLLGRQ
jgi:hypothetical protein